MKMVKCVCVVFTIVTAFCCFKTSFAVDTTLPADSTTIKITSETELDSEEVTSKTELSDLKFTLTETEELTQTTPQIFSEQTTEDSLLEEEENHYTNASRILPANTAPLAAGAFPFSAYVEGIGSPSLRGCTGALISLRFVLVPASCVDGVSSVTVRLGGVATDDGTQVLTATKIMHPKYKTSSKDYNIALLRLSPMATASATVSPIELAPKSSSDDNKDIAGFSMTVIGYGPLVANGLLATKILRSVELSVLGKSECIQLYKSTNVNANVNNIPYSSKQSCLGTSETRGLCGQEDMGAPVFQGTTPATFRLYGIVTFINSCTSSIPALFTRIGPHYDWITKIMRNYAF